MLRLDYDASSAMAGLDGIAAAAAAVVRPVAQAGAQVLYEEARRRAPVGEPHVGKGGKHYPGGTLKASIYQVYSTDKSAQGRAVYHVSWNAAKAPHGHLIEFGHWQMHRVVKLAEGRFISLKAEKLPQPRWIAAQPFIRPAFDARLQAALQAANIELIRRMEGKL